MSRMQKRFEQPWVLGTDKEYLRALFCDFIYKDPSWKEDHILLALDYMLTQIKRTRLAWLHFDEEVEQEMFRRRKIAELLQDAVQEKRFQVWYQPVCSLADERYVSLEALSRLHHPALGWIPPDMFIRAAIHSGQMRRITPLQLERVCRFAQENGQIFDGIRNIKFNLTPDELLDAEYCRSLLDIIRAHGLPFARFQFEITETVATQYARALEESVQALQSAADP